MNIREKNKRRERLRHYQWTQILSAFHSIPIVNPSNLNHETKYPLILVIDIRGPPHGNFEQTVNSRQLNRFLSDVRIRLVGKVSARICSYRALQVHFIYILKE